MCISASRRSWAFLVVCGLASLLLAGAGAAEPHAPKARIEQAVLDQLGVENEATFWVVLGEQADLSHAQHIPSWNARGRYVYALLRDTAERSQRGLRDDLDRRRVAYRPSWIVNAVRVTANRDTMLSLASRAEVREILATRTYTLPRPTPVPDDAGIAAVEWNIARINAPQVWTQFGVRGEGIVVANIDTGVQFDHGTLVLQYRGDLGGGQFDHDYNWFDGTRSCTNPADTPCDNDGHGTHTMGTMVGGDGFAEIGVAPGARWIAAKGCAAGGCTDQALLDSGEWMLAPTDLAGNNPRADLRPHVINNSWGSDDGSDLFYGSTIQAWIASGIFPVFSIGNNGPGCGTAGSPGGQTDAFSVGAFNINDAISSFSSRGPSPLSRSAKPDIAAPGEGIRSSVPFNAFATFSGTSMAAPHVAGTVALMISAAPSLAGDIPALRQLLRETAIDTSDLTCGGTAANNNVWGEGRLDAFAAVERSPRSVNGTLAGTVVDGLQRTPIAGALVSATGQPDGNALTDEAGVYEMPLPEGSYDVTASADGYVAEEADADVSADATTVVDFALTPLETRAVGGIVRNLAGRPLSEVVLTIPGVTIGQVRSDATGAYKFPAVPVGTHEVHAEAGGCHAGTTQTLVVDGDEALDFALEDRYDDFGYGCRVVSTRWQPAKAALALSGNDEFAEVSLPFTFEFYGASYDRVYVSTNGFVTFTAPSLEPENESIPNPATPNAAIYAYWDDLLIDDQASVRTQVIGTAPERRFVIEWRNATFQDDAARRIDIELVLTERLHGIVMAYRGIADDARERGASATFGIESLAGDGLEYSFDEAMLASPYFGLAFFERRNEHVAAD